MKYILHTLLGVTIISCAAGGAFAEGMKTQQGQSADSYSTMEPAAGDPDRQIMLDNSEVSRLQRALNDKGYSTGPDDGVMGAMTTEALRDFQEDNDLTVTGTVTSETLSKLDLELKKRSQQ